MALITSTKLFYTSNQFSNQIDDLLVVWHSGQLSYDQQCGRWVQAERYSSAVRLGR